MSLLLILPINYNFNGLYIHRCVDNDSDCGDVSWHLKFNNVVLWVSEYHVFIDFGSSDVIQLAVSLKRDLCIFKQPQVGRISFIEQEWGFYEYFSSKEDYKNEAY